MDTKFYRFVRMLAWPLIVIVGLNIESWASANGYSTMLSQFLPTSGIVADGYALVTGPIMTHVAAFLAGAVILVWAGYWFERIEEKHPDGPPMWVHTGNFFSLQLMLDKGQLRRWGYPIEHKLKKANKSLRALGLTELPDNVEDLLSARLESAAYLTSLQALIDVDQWDAVSSISETFGSKIQGAIEKPQPR